MYVAEVALCLCALVSKDNERCSLLNSIKVCLLACLFDVSIPDAFRLVNSIRVICGLEHLQYRIETIVRLLALPRALSLRFVLLLDLQDPLCFAL